MSRLSCFGSFWVGSLIFAREVTLQIANLETYNWAQQTQQNDLCAQQRFRSAWAYAQSEQSLHYTCYEQLKTQPIFMWTVKTDLTEQKPSEVRVFAGCTDHFVGFVMLWLNYYLVRTSHCHKMIAPVYPGLTLRMVYVSKIWNSYWPHSGDSLFFIQICFSRAIFSVFSFAFVYSLIAYFVYLFISWVSVYC